MLEPSHMDLEYTALLLLAGLIALFGLLENSAAVVIGAMLISPLMNPLLSAALALLLGDGKMGKRAAIVLAVNIAAIIGITRLVAAPSLSNRPLRKFWREPSRIFWICSLLCCRAWPVRGLIVTVWLP
ncbi:MAG: DUF389 domain-containing protein [Acidobacteriaceae bacterium]